MDEIFSQEDLAIFSDFMESDSEEAEFKVTRDEDSDTFKEEDMVRMHDLIRLFIGARVMGKWPVTGEPPKNLKVKISVETY